MSEKRTKFDRLQWNVKRLEKRDEIRLEPNILDVLDLDQEYAQTAGPVAVAIEAEEMIRRRAYELYEARGRRDGYDIEDWLQAEAEICAAAPPGKVIPFRSARKVR